VNCPKCGFVQEDRVDCRKCGVVFAKYLAIYPPDNPASGESPEMVEAPPAATIELDPHELNEMRQTVRDLCRRFSELDFERIERSRMRAEIRGLEQQLQEALAQVTAQLTDHGRQISELYMRPAGPTVQDLETLREELHTGHLAPITQHVSQLGDRMLAMQNTVAALNDARMIEVLKKLDQRQTELEAKIAALSEGTAQTSEPSPQDESLRAVEELRAALQNVTVRYSEIGELKKNHLVLENRLTELGQRRDTVGAKAFTGTAARMAELEKEVTALRAEVRQALTRVESLSAAASSPRAQSGDGEKVRATLSALEAKLNQGMEALSGLPEKVQMLAGQIPQVEKRAKERLDNIETMVEAFISRPRQDPDPPPPDDMHTIRENLDEIRRFMHTLSRKL